MVSSFREGRLPSTNGLNERCLSGRWLWLRNFNTRFWSVGDTIGRVSVPSNVALRISTLGKWLHSASTLMLEIKITQVIVACCCIWCLQCVSHVYKYYKHIMATCICILNASRISPWIIKAVDNSVFTLYALGPLIRPSWWFAKLSDNLCFLLLMYRILECVLEPKSCRSCKDHLHTMWLWDFYKFWDY